MATSKSSNAPLLLRAAFGRELCQELVGLCQAAPDLVRQLALYDVRNFHAVVAWLLLAPRPAEDEAAIAATLMSTAPRQLLEAAFAEHRRELWSAFKALPSTAMPGSFYQRLDLLTRGPAASLVAEADKLHPADLAYFEAVAEYLPREPLLRCCTSALGGRASLVRVAYSALLMLRALGVLGPEADAAAALHAARSTAAFGRLFMRRLAKKELEVPAPPENSPLRPITSVAELRATGRRLRNCLSQNYSHMVELLTQRTWFYEWCGTTPGAISLEVLGPNLAAISEVAGEDNNALDEDVQKAMVKEIEAAGITLLPQGLHGILHRFDEEDEMAEEMKSFFAGEEMDEFSEAV